MVEHEHTSDQHRERRGGGGESLQLKVFFELHPSISLPDLDN